MLKISLAAARVNKGLSQQEAAKALNISNSTLVNWEAGKSYPKPPMIAKICELYEVHYDNIRFNTN